MSGNEKTKKVKGMRISLTTWEVLKHIGAESKPSTPLGKEVKSSLFLSTVSQRDREKAVRDQRIRLEKPRREPFFVAFRPARETDLCEMAPHKKEEKSPRFLRN